MRAAIIRTAGVLVVSTLAACGESGSASGNNPPHVDHVNLPVHKPWQVVSVQPYEGLEEVELVRFNWPTPQDPHSAFALTKEGLKPGDQICLDHIREIDTYWAHPVPAGGCAARTPVRGVR